MAEPDSQHPLESLIEEAIDTADNGKVTLGSLLDAFGNRSFGPMISLFALVAIVPPIGGIPLVPTTMGVLTILFAGQILIGRQSPWVPARLKDMGFDKEKVEKVRDKAGKWLARIDALVDKRLSLFAGDIAQWFAAACCVMVACLMPPLEAVPFAAALPASAILLFGLGLTARDGLLMLIGFALTGAALYFGYGWIFGGQG